MTTKIPRDILNSPSVSKQAHYVMGLIDRPTPKSRSRTSGRRDQPRVPKGSPDGGEWTSEGGASSSGKETGIRPNGGGVIKLASDGKCPAQPGVSQEDQRAFIAYHLDDVTALSRGLGIPPSYIPGLAALESSWGTSRFVYDKKNGFRGNNYFGLHAGAPLETGTQKSDRDGPMATFSSFAQSARSFFASRKGQAVKGARARKNLQISCRKKANSVSTQTALRWQTTSKTSAKRFEGYREKLIRPTMLEWKNDPHLKSESIFSNSR